MADGKTSDQLMANKLPLTLSPGPPPPPPAKEATIHRPAPGDSHFEIMDLPGLP